MVNRTHQGTAEMKVTGRPGLRRETGSVVFGSEGRVGGRLRVKVYNNYSNTENLPKLFLNPSPAFCALMHSSYSQLCLHIRNPAGR